MNEEQIHKLLRGSTINQKLLFVLYCISAGKTASRQLLRTRKGRDLYDVICIDDKQALQKVHEMCANVPLCEIDFNMEDLSFRQEKQLYKLFGYACQKNQDHMIHDWIAPLNKPRNNLRQFVAPTHFVYARNPIRDIIVTVTGTFAGEPHLIFRQAAPVGNTFIYGSPKKIAPFQRLGVTNTWVARLQGLVWLAYHWDSLLDLTIMIESLKIPQNVTISYDYVESHLNMLCETSFIQLARDRFGNASHL